MGGQDRRPLSPHTELPRVSEVVGSGLTPGPAELLGGGSRWRQTRRHTFLLRASDTQNCLPHCTAGSLPTAPPTPGEAGAHPQAQTAASEPRAYSRSPFLGGESARRAGWVGRRPVGCRLRGGGGGGAKAHRRGVVLILASLTGSVASSPASSGPPSVGVCYR